MYCCDIKLLQTSQSDFKIKPFILKTFRNKNLE